MSGIAEKQVYKFDVAVPLTEPFPADLVRGHPGFQTCVHTVGDVKITLQVRHCKECIKAYLHVQYPKSFEQLDSMLWFCDLERAFEHDVTLLHNSNPDNNLKWSIKPQDIHACMAGACEENYFYNDAFFGDRRKPISLAELDKAGWIMQGMLRFRVKIVGDFDFFSKRMALHNSGVSEDPVVSMWRDKSFADFYIAAKGEEIRCHRSVLAAASPFFAAMLSNEMEESLQTFASIDELPDCISLMLEFMYTKSLPITVDCSSLICLLRLADCYQLPHLFEVCWQRIPSRVDHTNIVEVISGLWLLRGIQKCEQLFRMVLLEVRNNLGMIELLADYVATRHVEEQRQSLYANDGGIQQKLAQSSDEPHGPNPPLGIPTSLVCKSSEPRSRSRSPSGGGLGSGSSCIPEHGSEQAKSDQSCE